MHLALCPQFTCPHLAAPLSPRRKYFNSATALATHEGEKPHKRKVKMLNTTARPHNQRDAEAAAGMGAPDNGPKLRVGREAGAAEMDL